MIAFRYSFRMVFLFQRHLGVKCSMKVVLILCAVLTAQFLGWSARDLENFLKSFGFRNMHETITLFQLWLPAIKIRLSKLRYMLINWHCRICDHIIIFIMQGKCFPCFKLLSIRIVIALCILICLFLCRRYST